MEQNSIMQTPLDQLVSDERSQMLKAFVPYLPARGQQLLSLYTKGQEFANTLRLFSPQNQNMQVCAASVPDVEPMALINDLRKYSYGKSQQQLDQLNNLLVMMEMLSVMK